MNFKKLQFFILNIGPWCHKDGKCDKELFIKYNQLKTYHNCVELLLHKHTILSKSYLEYKLISMKDNFR